MSGYMPTTEEVRTDYETYNAVDPVLNPSRSPDVEFDRWLSAHDASVRKAALETLDAVLQNIVTDPRVRADGLLNQINHDFAAALGDAPTGGE